MNFFYNKTDESVILNQTINKKIQEFITIIDSELNLKKYVKSLWIIWPCARSEWFYINNKVRSDIDIYVMTSRISFSNAKKLNKLFKSIFDEKLDVSLLYFSPNSWKKPDLMMYELTNSGKLLYWDKMEEITLSQISKLETIRNLAYRWFYFLENFENNQWKLVIKDKVSDFQFLYGFSKIVFSLWEVCLLLSGRYSASNFQREKNIKNNFYASQIDWFLDLHYKMHNFRYNQEVPKDFDRNAYIKIGFKYIQLWYDLILSELFDSNTIFVDKFNNLRSQWISFFANRILYFLINIITYRRIKLNILKEPFIDFIQNYYILIQKVNKWEKLGDVELKYLQIDWKTAPWFYYKL